MTNDLPKITDLKITIDALAESWLGESQARTIEIKKDKDSSFKAFAKIGEGLTEDEKQDILEAVKDALGAAHLNQVGTVTINPSTIHPGEKHVVEIDFSDPHFQGLVIIVPRDETIRLTRVTYSRFTLKESMLTRTDKEIRLFFSVSDSLQAEKSPQGVQLDFDVRSKESPEYGIAKTSTVQVVAKDSTQSDRQFCPEYAALTEWTLGLS